MPCCHAAGGGFWPVVTRGEWECCGDCRRSVRKYSLNETSGAVAAPRTRGGYPCVSPLRGASGFSGNHAKGHTTRKVREPEEDHPSLADPGVREVLFPKRGFSATEQLLAINVIVAAALLLAWGRDYGVNLRHWVDVWWGAVRAHQAYGWWL